MCSFLTILAAEGMDRMVPVGFGMAVVKWTDIKVKELTIMQ